MGSLILCYSQKASQPYELAGIHRKIYTLEELGYYLNEYLYMVDEGILNEGLCSWIFEELGMEALAGRLFRICRSCGSPEQFVMLILKSIPLYTEKELEKVASVLEKLKNQNETERKKFKADSLADDGQLEEAMLVYMEILKDIREKEETKKEFEGRVYACMGALYGKQFLYEQAAAMYEKAYEVWKEESLLAPYLYCCRNYMDKQAYETLIKGKEAYGKIEEKLKKRQQDEKMKLQPAGPSLLEDLKERYRAGEMFDKQEKVC